MLALDGEGRLLLVRHSYGTGAWMPPGGGLRRGEDPLAAGLRELAEETDCHLLDARLVEVRSEPLHGAENIVRIVAGQALGEPVADGREIIEVRFFALDALPADMPRGQGEALRRWVSAYCSAIRPRQPQ